MAKSKGARGAGPSAAGEVERRALGVADEMGLELVEVTLQKESRGKCLCVYVDKEGGLSLDDCERYHKRLQPMLEDVDYDIMEVSSPGADRPVKPGAILKKHRGRIGGGQALCGPRRRKGVSRLLTDMDDDSVTITDAQDQPQVFRRREVAVVKPVIELDEDDFADVDFDALDDEE